MIARCDKIMLCQCHVGSVVVNFQSETIHISFRVTYPSFQTQKGDFLFTKREPYKLCYVASQYPHPPNDHRSPQTSGEWFLVSLRARQQRAMANLSETRVNCDEGVKGAGEDEYGCQDVDDG